VAPAAALMSRRNLLNLALLLVAAALAAIIVLRPGLKPAATHAPLSTLDPQQVTRIELVRKAGATLRFRKTGAHWRIDATPELSADDFQMSTVLALLQAAPVRSYPVHDLDLAKVGLDPPQASAHFDRVALDLGDTDAIDNLRYVRSGATVYLVADRYAHLLNAGVANFVQRTLLPGDAHIRALQLPGLSLTQTDTVHWQLQPDDHNAGADRIQDLLRNWRHASALYVARADTPATGDTVRVTLAGRAEPLVFTIVARSPDLVLGRPDLGLQYHLPGTAATQLLALPPPVPEPAPAAAPGRTGS
jgi:hypothetical protein